MKPGNYLEASPAATVPAATVGNRDAVPDPASSSVLVMATTDKTDGRALPSESSVLDASGTAPLKMTIDAGTFGTYPGGKSGAGVFQTIINQQPPHAVYVEPFLGHGGVFRRKRLAGRNIGVDLDAAVIARWRDTSRRTPAFELHHGDALEYLAAYPWTGAELVYLDPPYLIETRSSGRLYLHEMTEDQHRALLALIKRLPCRVQVSGYPSELYARELAGWRVVEFEAMTRGGRKATECLWMNYPEPQMLHTTWYAGSNYRERERIKRRRQRWARRLAAMDPTERQVILEALQQIAQGEANDA
jgi:DNA adenine methylase